MARRSVIVLAATLVACGGSAEPVRVDLDSGADSAPVADGGSSSCPLLDEVAVVSPRADMEAELLAIEASKKAAAPDDVYTRIVRDLSDIRARFASVAGIRARASWVVESPFTLRVDGETIAAIRAGTFHGWDCANGRFGMTGWRELANPYSIPTIALELGGRRLDYERLYAEYSLIAGVSKEKMWDAWDGDGDDICALANGAELSYVLKHGAGDCPSGCTENAYWGFASNDGASPVELGSWDDTSGTPPPAWFTQRREACRGRL
jgi:hypothetical protein